MCTIHAESARQAIERKFDQAVALSGRSMPAVKEYLGELVDMVIQIRRQDGVRQITDIYLPKENRSLLGDDG